MPTQADRQRHCNADEPPGSFWRLLYRFLFFGWLFTDVRTARNPYERRAALRHNREMSRHLPLYLRRWSVLAAAGFALGLLAEQAPDATLLSALFFTGACVTLSGMVVIVVAWAVLARGRLP